MRSLISCLLLVILFSAFECRRQENAKPSLENQPITDSPLTPFVGKWQLVEYYLSAGGPGYWTKADPAKPSIIELKADGKFISDNENCSGQYTAAPNQEIIIKQLCNNETVQERELSGKILPSGELSIVPTNPKCIEGCLYKYKRIQ